MSTTTTANASWTCDNTTGTTGFKFRYRLSGETVWNAVTVTGTTVAVSDLEINRLYDFQIVNINGAENPACAVYQNINMHAFYRAKIMAQLHTLNLQNILY